MTQPTVSVVIPCYNARQYVAATLESVLAQGDVVGEIIVVDDGSADGSATLVRQLYPQVRVIEQANQGVAVARNTGVAASRCDWIAFVDADDIWLPGKLAAQLRLLASQADARMSYTAWHVWHCAEPVPAPALLAELQASAADTRRWAGATGWLYTDLLLDCVVWTSTVLVHRSVLDEVGVFDPTLRIGEDYDLWLRASRVTPILRLSAPTALYRMHPGSITRRVPDRNYKGEVVGRALARWGYRAPDGALADKTGVDRGLARSWSDYAGAQLMAGDVQRAREGAKQALRVMPGHALAWKVLIKAWLRSVIGGAVARG
jgi:glycosyltransferase involved in cell wall biosynthesis